MKRLLTAAALVLAACGAPEEEAAALDAEGLEWRRRR